MTIGLASTAVQWRVAPRNIFRVLVILQKGLREILHGRNASKRTADLLQLNSERHKVLEMTRLMHYRAKVHESNS